MSKNGVVLVNKPTGMTSNTLAKKVGKLVGEKKVGHMGTLDPYGTGLMAVLCGKATRLFDCATNKDKTYRAVFKFGVQTDTLDSEGKIIFNKKTNIKIDDIKKVLKKFEGEINQMPPDFSSKKINGKKAYQLARAGERVELKPKKVSVYKIDVIKEIKENTFLFEIACSTGTYIRSICRDIASELSTYGTMCAICRTKCCGNMDLLNSLTIEDINENTELIGCDNYIDLPIVNINKIYLKNLINGVKVKIPDESLDFDKFKLYCGDDFYGVAINDCGFVKVVSNFYGGNV